MYLFAVMDWASRGVLSWWLLNTLTTDLCLKAVKETINRYGKIWHLQQHGYQFTSFEFTGLLKAIASRSEGQGWWRENVFVESLWKSIKYEEVYLYAYDSVSQVKRGLGQHFTYHTSRGFTRRLTTTRRMSSIAITGLCCQKSRRQEPARLNLKNGKFCPNNRSHCTNKKCVGMPDKGSGDQLAIVP